MHMLQHGLARQGYQRFARQPGRGITGRDHDHEIRHATDHTGSTGCMTDALTCNVQVQKAGAGKYSYMLVMSIAIPGVAIWPIMPICMW